MALTGVLRPGHAQVRVLDLDESVRFLQEVLGLVETGRDALWTGVFQVLGRTRSSQLRDPPADRAGIDFFGFRVLDTATLDKLDADLKAYGLKTERIPAGEMLATASACASSCPPATSWNCSPIKPKVGNGIRWSTGALGQGTRQRHRAGPPRPCAAVRPERGRSAEDLHRGARLLPRRRVLTPGRKQCKTRRSGCPAARRCMTSPSPESRSRASCTTVPS